MTTIRLHDSMTRRKRDFTPIDPSNVRMYVCGPTVYDRAHIGNARPAVVFDVLARLLRHVYGPEHVTYVRNITDVEDKIIVRAAERGVPIDTVTEETIAWYHEDMDALGVSRPDHEPRATDHIPGMIAMIERLIAEGKAYEAEGHVLFEVGTYPDYGALSGRSTEDMIAGARVEVAPYKRDPMDFVLWKPSAADQPGWDSPWGRGRPGWHIECSAMSDKLLWSDPLAAGTLSAEALRHPHEFDIHGGGSDLIFPHHENEIAQSCCSTGGRFARYWLHNGMVLVDGRKMSKSLGNFLTVEDMRHQAPGEVLRLALLSSHYRAPLDWTDKLLKDAATNMTQWERVLRDARKSGLFTEEETAPDEEVVAALADDLNTPLARARINALAGEARLGTPGAANKLKSSLALMGFKVEGFRDAMVRASVDEAFDVAEKIDALLAARAEARKAKDFAKADAIRAALDTAGVVVMDRTGGPTEWELAPGFDAAKLQGVDA